MRRALPLVLTQGNGPMFGKILMRQALVHTTIAPMSMGVCVEHRQAGTQILAVEHRA